MFEFLDRTIAPLTDQISIGESWYREYNLNGKSEARAPIYGI